MTEHAATVGHAQAHGHDAGAHDAHPRGAEHPHPPYVKIWGTLVVLLMISILGPRLGLVWVTLITAFGIALVKAYMVAAYFMHLKIERMYIKYLLLGLLIIVGVFFFGVAPDVMKKAGTNWQQTYVERAPSAPAHE